MMDGGDRLIVIVATLTYTTTSAPLTPTNTSRKYHGPQEDINGDEWWA